MPRSFAETEKQRVKCLRIQYRTMGILSIEQGRRSVIIVTSANLTEPFEEGFALHMVDISRTVPVITVSKPSDYHYY